VGARGSHEAGVKGGFMNNKNDIREIVFATSIFVSLVVSVAVILWYTLNP
jgi:hypothetical protein